MTQPDHRSDPDEGAAPSVASDPESSGTGQAEFDDGIARYAPGDSGAPPIAETLYAATDELEAATPELRATTDSIAEVLITLTDNADTAALLIDEPDPAALLTDGRADQLAALLTQAAGQAKTLASILEDAADDADGLAAVLTDDRIDGRIDEDS
jgi:ABC-type transporter Mla subunit MlaD